MRGATGVEKINKKKRVKIEIIGGEVDTWLHEVKTKSSVCFQERERENNKRFW